MGNDSRIRSTLNCEWGMKPISGIVNSISELIGQLTLPAREKKRAGNRVVEIDSGTGTGISTGESDHGTGGSERELVATVMASAGDVDVCQCYFDRDFYQFTDSG